MLVRDASSKARTNPRTETIRAVSLRRGGIDIIGVLRGRVFERMIKPATILPITSRFKGLITAGLFSLIGERELKRG